MAKKTKKSTSEPATKVTAPASSQPPLDVKDPITMRSTKTKAQALKEWFSSAKASSSGSFEWMIDAKQALDAKPKKPRKK